MIFDSFEGFEGFEDFSSNNFTNIIYEHNLKPDYFISREDEKIIINEIWSDDSSDIIANRIYEFDSFFTDLIPEEIKLDILNDVLEIYVEVENYEEAAIIRDQIKELN